MRSRLWAVGTLVSAVAVVVLFLNRPPVTAQEKQKPARTSWEYTVINSDHAKVQELGEQGWEVFGVTGGQPYIESYRVLGGTTTTQNTVKHSPVVYHMKRQK